MDSTKRFLPGKTCGKDQFCSPPVIDPRLLSIGCGSPSAEIPSAALSSAGAPWNRGPKQPDFQKDLSDETDVPRHISQHTKFDLLQPSMATNTISTAGIDGIVPTAIIPSIATDSLMHNDFDAAFLELDTCSDTENLDTNAISYLSLWVAKNKIIQPPLKQLKALETLTEIPASRLLAWLNRHGKALLAEQDPAPNRAKVHSVAEELYFVRCLKSGFRYKSRKSHSDEPKAFECTNQCGQLFCRKGDWGRHERLNFEEWPCPHCGKVLSRCEHLRAHFKDAHPVEKDISKYRKRVFLTARQRPCGFCGYTLTNWSAWLAHVASHFEELRADRGRTMSDWTEHRFFDEVEPGIEVTAPEESMIATMTIPRASLHYVTSSARQYPHPNPLEGESRSTTDGIATNGLRSEAELLDRVNDKDEKSAKQDKYDGRDIEHYLHKAFESSIEDMPSPRGSCVPDDDTSCPTAISPSSNYLPMACELLWPGSSQHVRQPTRPSQAGQAGRDIEFEGSDDELTGMYGALSLQEMCSEALTQFAAVMEVNHADEECYRYEIPASIYQSAGVLERSSSWAI